jgi:hypothetical protein
LPEEQALDKAQAQVLEPAVAVLAQVLAALPRVAVEQAVVLPVGSQPKRLMQIKA